MIRKLLEQDREIVMGFVSEEPSINLFIIGDIEVFGFDKDFQELWGQFDESLNVEGILLRYKESFVVYSKKDIDFSGFKNILIKKSKESDIMISGKESIIKNFYGLLPGYSPRITYLCELRNKDNISISSTYQIREAKVTDVERLYNMIEEIEEFSGAINSIDRYEHKLKSKMGRIYYIEDENGKLISTSQTTAENSKSAMIVGVATLKEHRNKGYMTACLSKLCMDLLEEGKIACLFYDNPYAGKVYHKIGFERIDNWVMIKRREFIK